MMLIYFKIDPLDALENRPLSESAYPFDCTFYRSICLTAKALRRMTMRGFLVIATGPVKRTLKQVQRRILG